MCKMCIGLSVCVCVCVCVCVHKKAMCSSSASQQMVSNLRRVAPLLRTQRELRTPSGAHTVINHQRTHKNTTHTHTHTTHALKHGK